MACAQVLFSVMQNFRPEIPPEEQLPGKPGVTLPRCAQRAAALCRLQAGYAWPTQRAPGCKPRTCLPAAYTHIAHTHNNHTPFQLAILFSSIHPWSFICCGVVCWGCRYLSLMERCWAEDEHARPTFEELLLELDDLRSCEAGQARLKGSESQRCDVHPARQLQGTLSS